MFPSLNVVYKHPSKFSDVARGTSNTTRNTNTATIIISDSASPALSLRLVWLLEY